MDNDNNMQQSCVTGSHNEQALLRLMEKTGYTMLQENGQRKYGGPPPGWEKAPPCKGSEVFVGKIPRDCYEDELVPVFESIGVIYELRLMMDFSGTNRGYGFVAYTCPQDAKRAIKELNNFEIRKGRLLGVVKSVDNCRLFVGGIPKNKTRDEIFQEMTKVTDDVEKVIVYPSATDKTKNRGFSFVQYISHRSAAMARRKLIPGRIQLWGHTIAVDWAEPEQEVDEDVMATVRVLYIRNLMLTTTEEKIKDVCQKAVGNENGVERVKKIRDYAFVHFRERDDALNAMKMLNGSVLEGSRVEVVVAKPIDKLDHIRYTRAAGRCGLAELEAQGMYNPYESLYQTPSSIYQMPSPTTNNVAQDRELAQVTQQMLSVRTPIRGRARGAGGTRGAGGMRPIYQGAVRAGFRRPPIERHHLFDFIPGMHLTLTDPITLKPHQIRHSTQILEEYCHKHGWGTPHYHLHSTMDGGGDVQLFLFKVIVPAIQLGTPFQPNKLCKTVEEAKIYAAEFVIAQLSIPYEDIPACDLTTNYTAPPPLPVSSPFIMTSQMMKMPPPPPPPTVPSGDFANLSQFHSFPTHHNPF